MTLKWHDAPNSVLMYIILFVVLFISTSVGLEWPAYRSMIPEIPDEQVRGAIESTAVETLAEGDVHAPPVDAFQLAERLGMVVARDVVGASTRARFARLGGFTAHNQAAILLADDPRPERRQWAVAHEIGESLAELVFDKLGVDPREAPHAARENVANRLAGHLLLPSDWFVQDGLAVDWDLLELKRRYATAIYELVARRMLEMPVGVVITLADQGQIQWRLSNRFLRTPPLTAAERCAWQAAFTHGESARCEPGDLPDGIEDVRAWPIHEPEWRREIIRTVLADEW